MASYIRPVDIAEEVWVSFEQFLPCICFVWGALGVVCLVNGAM